MNGSRWNDPPFRRNSRASIDGAATTILDALNREAVIEAVRHVAPYVIGPGMAAAPGMLHVLRGQAIETHEPSAGQGPAAVTARSAIAELKLINGGSV